LFPQLLEIIYLYNWGGVKNFMEQIEVSKQSSDKSGEVSVAIVKPPERRESAILPLQNGDTILASINFGIFHKLGINKK
jgi:hypothetical protein